MLRRFASLPLLIGLCIIFGAGLLVSAPTQAALDPVALACPNRQTTILTGAGAQPGASLIAYLQARPVAGGSVGPAGSWSIPLKPNERPGIYSVEVKLRGSLAIVARFTCYVDVPLDVTQTPDPALIDTVAPTAPAPTATPPGVPVPTATVAATATTGGTATRTTTAGTATRTTTAGTATRTVTGTVTTTTTTTTTAGTATTTATSGTAAVDIKINDVVCRAPTDDPTFEYIELVNNGTAEVNLTGWKIINTSQSNATFTFPAYTIEGGPDIYIVVYGGIGTNRTDIGEFYWGNNNQIWHISDKVEVRNGSNQLVTSLTVPADSCTS